MPRRDGDYQDALRDDQGWYTVPRLMGKAGVLWAWGEHMMEGASTAQPPGWRDSFATLGMQPQHVSAVHSPLPVDVRVLDVLAAWSRLRAGRGEVPLHHPWAREPWTPAQMILYLYYARGYGHSLPADSRNRTHYAAAVATYGVNGKVGDGAVAELLRFVPEVVRSENPEMWVYGRRRRAIARLSADLRGMVIQ